MFVIFLFIALLVVAFALYHYFRKTDVLRLGKPKESAGEPVDVANVMGEPVEEEGIKVRIDDFLEQYIVGDSIPESVLMELQLKRLAGEEEACVSKEVIERAKRRCDRYWKSETAREACLALEEKARAKEENGDLEAAIDLYERNASSGYPAYYSFDRLVTIYTERGELTKKVEVLRKAVLSFGAAHPVLREICQYKLDKAEEERKQQLKS